MGAVKWRRLSPDKKANWITNDTDQEFEALLPAASKEVKSGSSGITIFRTYSLGVSTNRDAVVYDFQKKRLAERVEKFTEAYNAELHRWQKKGRPEDLDNFVSYEYLKWSETLKRNFIDNKQGVYNKKFIVKSLYRPFTEQWLYYDQHYVDRPGLFSKFIQTGDSKEKNPMLVAPSTGGRSPYWIFSTNLLPNLNFVSIDSAQCFPLYTYSDADKERSDNITRNALNLFQVFYDDHQITREDIFYYVYALLHHPAYRTRYAENLKRELPRIPFAGIPAGAKEKATAHFFPLSSVEKMKGKDGPEHHPELSTKLFVTFAAAGRKLADLHAGYESVQEFRLKRVENKKVKLDWRVETMKLSKDKTSLVYNDFLTLEGIPPEVFEYRLGNRSALDWIIDQYRVDRDEKGNITSDPNRLDDEEYIVRLIGQVITVSLETLKIVKALPPVAFA